jgi:hypothetical protein
MRYFTILILFISFNSFAENYNNFLNKSNSFKYIVKKGDTLSQILNDNGIYNIYKKQARQKSPIFKAMWKNGFSKSDIKKLEVGQVIYLPIINDRSIASIKTNPLIENISDKEIKRIVIKYSEEND